MNNIQITKKNDITYITCNGTEIASGDFDSMADGWFMNIEGIKGQKFFSEKADMINYFS